jgi:hypothetical protein
MKEFGINVDFRACFFILTFLQLILINVFDFLRLDAQVIQGLPLCAVIKADHQFEQVTPKGYPLMETPCFAKRMRTVVAFQVDFSTLFFLKNKALSIITLDDIIF